MIDIKDISDIDIETDEGKLLISALSILTTNNFTDKTPFDVLKMLSDLGNQIFYLNEYKLHLRSIERDKKIEDLL